MRCCSVIWGSRLYDAGVEDAVFGDGGGGDDAGPHYLPLSGGERGVVVVGWRLRDWGCGVFDGLCRRWLRRQGDGALLRASSADFGLYAGDEGAVHLRLVVGDAGRIERELEVADLGLHFFDAKLLLHSRVVCAGLLAGF